MPVESCAHAVSRHITEALETRELSRTGRTAMRRYWKRNFHFDSSQQAFIVSLSSPKQTDGNQGPVCLQMSMALDDPRIDILLTQDGSYQRYGEYLEADRIAQLSAVGLLQEEVYRLVDIVERVATPIHEGHLDVARRMLWPVFEDSFYISDNI